MRVELFSVGIGARLYATGRTCVSSGVHSIFCAGAHTAAINFLSRCAFLVWTKRFEQSTHKHKYFYQKGLERSANYLITFSHLFEIPYKIIKAKQKRLLSYKVVSL